MNGRPSCSACNGTGTISAGVQKCVRCADVVEQCRDWLLLKCPPAVSGGGGHNAAFHAACTIVSGFDLRGAVAEQLFAEWNSRCSPPWNEKDCAHKLKQATVAAGRDKEPGFLIWKRGSSTWTGASAKEAADLRKRAGRQQHYDSTKAAEFDAVALKSALAVGGGSEGTDVEWVNFFREKSASDVVHVDAEGFLNALYERGERVLVFTEFRSQGNFCYEVGVGWWKLGQAPKSENERCERPRDSWKEGVWFLSQPVRGGWIVKPGSKSREERTFTRRSGGNVTAWRYMLLESDQAGIETAWLSLLARLPLPIVAIYTSGGRSAHALVRLDAETKEQWDAAADLLKKLVTTLGGDRGVFSAVRLTRLPGFLREGTVDKSGAYVRYAEPRLQRLLYLNPANHGEATASILKQRRNREVKKLQHG